MSSAGVAIISASWIPSIAMCHLQEATVDLKLALVADKADSSQEGKVNVLGVFSTAHEQPTRRRPDQG